MSPYWKWANVWDVPFMYRKYLPKSELVSPKNKSITNAMVTCNMCINSISKYTISFYGCKPFVFNDKLFYGRVYTTVCCIWKVLFTSVVFVMQGHILSILVLHLYFFVYRMIFLALFFINTITVLNWWSPEMIF